MKKIKTFETFNIDIYEHGRCELFALALHLELGYDIFFYLDNDAEIETENGEYVFETVLVHAFAKDYRGNMFDATGEINKEDLEDHAEWVNSPQILKIKNKDMFDDYVKTKFLSDYDIKDISECRRYIRSDINKYTK